MTDERLLEAYDRLHRYGPEFGGDEEGNHGLTNHGPMAVEVLVRRGLDVDVTRWLDRYVPRLADLPRPTRPIEDRQQALGDARRLPDWTEHFARELRERPWADVLTEWWPRLLPGVVAGSTHGVIRVGHAVRTLTTGASPEALDELAHGLAFWAARYRPLPGAVAPAGELDAASALAGVTRLADQSGRIADRVGRLGGTAGWPESLRALRPADGADAARLAELVDAATGAYLAYGHGSPVLLVHTATAPNAVLHTLPALPQHLWEPSFDAAWAAAAAVVATYAPPEPLREGPAAPADEAEALHRAADHGDEHVIKFTDTAAEAYARTQDPAMLAATSHAGALIGRP